MSTYLKNKVEIKRTGGVAEVEQHLSNNGLSSKPKITHTEKVK
jgi:hypothetical protein